MKITSDSVNSVTRAATPSVNGNTNGAAQQVGGASSSTSIKLSDASRNLTGASEASATFDSAKVAKIKQAISEGKFQVNAGAVADKLIASVNELLSSRK